MAFEANANSEKKSKWARYANPVNWFKATANYIVESKNEFKRITWPSRAKVFRSTGVVITTIVTITLFIWLADSLFGQGLSLFFKAIE